MTKSRIRFLSTIILPAAIAGLLAAKPASAAEAPSGAALVDGKLHHYSGCLKQEPDGVRYFDLADAKTEDGKSLGTIRLTGSISGISPKETLGQRVQVQGMYRDRLPSKAGGEHIAVSHATVLSTSCI